MRNVTSTNNSETNLKVGSRYNNLSFSEDELKRAERIFSQIETLESPYKEEELVRLIFEEVDA